MIDFKLINYFNFGKGKTLLKFFTFLVENYFLKILKKMILLSVAIITFNEEKNIERCINSAKDVADEIVVLDSFSTDKTEEICKSHGVRFFQHKFDGHIEQKNRIITYCSNHYILSLDADEALSDTLKKSILTIKNNFSFDGYTMNRKTNYCGKWVNFSGWYPDTKLRLWDSRKGKWGGLNPHDKYEMNSFSKIKHIKGDILHYSYYSIKQHIEQSKKFGTIAANALKLKGSRPSIFKLIFNPFFKFIRNYILKLGFLDGYYGLIICIITAYGTYLKYLKLIQLYKNEKNFN